MESFRNTVKIEALISMGVVPAGVIHDKLGNTATLNHDGTVTLHETNATLSLHKSARLHNFLTNGVDKKVDGWRYWYVSFPEKSVNLQYFKNIIYGVVLLEISKAIASVSP